MTTQKIQNRLLLGISGGPDSMFMLYQYRFKNIVVATVDYAKRKDSQVDVEIVKKFCLNYRIPFETLRLSSEYKYEGNFQKIARDIRYDFYQKIYTKYNCSKLLLAHHKDDFLETAIMQKDSKRKVLFYGIKQKNIINSMSVYRPYLNRYWKDEILQKVKQLNIPFATDYTNDLDIYTRNKIRHRLQNYSISKKQKIYENFRFLNKNLTLKSRKILEQLKYWEQNDFSCDRDILKNISYYQNVIYEVIHRNFENISLSKTKIDSIWEFINSSNRTSCYKLKDNIYLEKKKNKLLLR